MRILYDSKNTKFKKPFGCVCEHENVEISIHIPTAVNTLSVRLVLTDDCGFCDSYEFSKSEQYDLYDIYTCNFRIKKPGLYFYYFEINSVNSDFKLFKYGYNDTNIEDGEMWQISCLPCDFKTPDIYKGAVMYQIFPDRFNSLGECDTEEKLTPFTVHNDKNDVPVFLPNEHGEITNSDFYGGNLKGIAEKLDYIADLGVKIIYLNPIFKAYSNHRYDTYDYKTIDPMLGTYDDFVSLCQKAKKLGISIILDGVFSHTGSNSIYFNSAISDSNSPYKEWYDFQEYPHTYSSWWGIRTLPNVNEMTPSYIDYIITGEDSVIKYWLKAGASGFRLDVADELPDEFLYLLRKTVKEINPQAIVIGEVWEDASNKFSYGVRRKYFTGPELDTVMNYPFKNCILEYVSGNISAKDFAESVMTIVENYPKETVDCLMNSLSTHDTLRAITFLGGKANHCDKNTKAYYKLIEDYESAKEMLKIAAFLQYMLPGNPCIYYGDEIGMEGYQDPFNRGYFKWDSIDNDLLSFFKELGKIKNSYKQLQVGETFVYNKENSVIIDRDDLRCIINLCDVDFQGDYIYKYKGLIITKGESNG